MVTEDKIYTTKFVPSRGHNESEIMLAPTSSECRGMGGLSRGRALGDENRPRFTETPISTIDLSQYFFLIC